MGVGVPVGIPICLAFMPNTADGTEVVFFGEPNFAARAEQPTTASTKRALPIATARSSAPSKVLPPVY